MLFDLDGVLVDSTPAVTRVWSVWAREHGLDGDYVTRIAHGRPSITTIRELLPHANHEAENRDVEQREIADTDGVIPLPGVTQILMALAARKWAIATSCTHPLAHVRIRAARLPTPPFLVTASDVARGKPDPEPYLKAAAGLGLAAGDCIVVEDAPSGIRAGRAAGARVLALRTTTADDELRAAGADWIVDDLAQVQFEARSDGARIALHFVERQ